MDERSIQLHLKKHDMDSRVAKVYSLLEHYNAQLDNTKLFIEPYRCDNSTYIGYSCSCGLSFTKKGNTIRHYQEQLACDKPMIWNVDLIKLLCCG
jgi:hypothetical protein